MSTLPKFGFALDYVKDIQAARHFYADVLGLRVEREHPTFVQFENFAIANDESMDGKGELELYWLVDDAEAAFKELSQTADISMPLKQLSFGKVFGLKDPEGRPRYLVELSANRPSRPVS